MKLSSIRQKFGEWFVEYALGHKKEKKKKGRRPVKKICPDCGAIFDGKIKKCTECGYAFYLDKKRTQKSIKKYKTEVKDWKNLIRGINIYIQTNDIWDGDDFDEPSVDMGYFGEGTIQNVTNKGLEVFTIVGRIFIDMVTTGRSKNNIVRTIPKIWTK